MSSAGSQREGDRRRTAGMFEREKSRLELVLEELHAYPKEAKPNGLLELSGFAVDLRGQSYVDDHALGMLVNLLVGTCGYVNALDLSRTGVGRHSAFLLQLLLRKNRAIRQVNLNHTRIHDEQVNLLCTVVTVDNPDVEFSLSGCKFVTPEARKALQEATEDRARRVRLYMEKGIRNGRDMVDAEEWQALEEALEAGEVAYVQELGNLGLDDARMLRALHGARVKHAAALEKHGGDESKVGGGYTLDLQGNAVTDEGLRGLARHIERYRPSNIGAIVLSRLPLVTEDGVVAVLEALHEDLRIKWIDLQHLEAVTNRVLKAVQGLLALNAHIEVRVDSASGMAENRKDDALFETCTHPRVWPRLNKGVQRRLNEVTAMSATQRRFESIVMFCKHMAAEKDEEAGGEYSLHVQPVLHWNDVEHLEDDAAWTVAQSLRGVTYVEELNLAGNGIGDAGAGYLAEMLLENKKLRVLNLDDNVIGEEGAHAFVDVLHHGNPWVHVSLEGNDGISAETLQRIRGLNEDPHREQNHKDHLMRTGKVPLDERFHERVHRANGSSFDGVLDVSNMGVNAEALVELQTVGWDRIERLVLADNAVGTRGIRWLFEELVPNHVMLHHVDLRHNVTLTRRSVRALCRCLRHQRTVTVVDLRNNPTLDDGCGEMVLELMQFYNPSVQVWMDAEDVGEEVHAAMEEVAMWSMEERLEACAEREWQDMAMEVEHGLAELQEELEAVAQREAKLTRLEKPKWHAPAEDGTPLRAEYDAMQDPHCRWAVQRKKKGKGRKTKGKGKRRGKRVVEVDVGTPYKETAELPKVLTPRERQEMVTRLSMPTAASAGRQVE